MENRPWGPSILHVTASDPPRFYIYVGAVKMKCREHRHVELETSLRRWIEEVVVGFVICFRPLENKQVKQNLAKRQPEPQAFSPRARATGATSSRGEQSKPPIWS